MIEEEKGVIGADRHLSAYSDWRGFFKSNLFVALVIWFLGQTGLVAGLIISMWLKTSSLSEWKSKIDATMDRMDKEGTIHSHYDIQQLSHEFDEYKAKVNRIEEDSRHYDVIESEHRRLTKDVEDLKQQHDKK